MDLLSIELRLIRIIYNSNLEDTLKEFKLFTLPGVKTRNIFMQNKKQVALRTTATYILGTAKGTLLFSRFLHKSLSLYLLNIYMFVSDYIGSGSV